MDMGEPQLSVGAYFCVCSAEIDESNPRRAFPGFASERSLLSVVLPAKDGDAAA